MKELKIEAHGQYNDEKEKQFQIFDTMGISLTDSNLIVTTNATP